MKLNWLWVNLKIGALSFGGSARMLLVQDEVVDRRGWVSAQRFREALTYSQIFPGPNLVNLITLLGFDRVGLVWTILALLCLAVPGAILIVVFAEVLNFQSQHVTLVFQGFSLASVVLFGIFSVRTFAGLREGTLGVRIKGTKYLARVILTAIVGAMNLFLWPLESILLVGGSLGLLIEWSLE